MYTQKGTKADAYVLLPVDGSMPTAAYAALEMEELAVHQAYLDAYAKKHKNKTRQRTSSFGKIRKCRNDTASTSEAEGGSAKQSKENEVAAASSEAEGSSAKKSKKKLDPTQKKKNKEEREEKKRKVDLELINSPDKKRCKGKPRNKQERKMQRDGNF